MTDENRIIRVTIRFKKSEFEKIEAKYKRTAFRHLNEYLRNVILDKKITNLYRNQSMDELMEGLILLRQELNYVGHNFNQAVKKLNSFAEMPDAHYWKKAMDISRNELEPCIKNIKDKMNNYADLWSQKLLAEKV
ncbi:plasmid mobilization protein [Pedobacter cryophilus]|uniref:Plasmid mobilization relaxosome protein MobC n=1 Tax=Pedobacter cryophilus TaxID=2571271 RepID=A0A4U1C6Y7_9SPHI|nr:plasmid mobilization relaxosome protein MobC [Pedobacter cryophilus]TKB99150.1 plasmid mobilization relaxosome protein MobC [Pedobacter cryophilus]